MKFKARSKRAFEALGKRSEDQWNFDDIINDSSATDLDQDTELSEDKRAFEALGKRAFEALGKRGLMSSHDRAGDYRRMNEHYKLASLFKLLKDSRRN